ncbi:hypothetical protein RRF57_010961 [Xylaria bambusicola]|uniref:Uncharacterized protein n=1 Tax=Xylaria bambusicola TaxID=326684 RepID=A0AAN7V257_9PEZI
MTKTIAIPIIAATQKRHRMKPSRLTYPASTIPAQPTPQLSSSSLVSIHLRRLREISGASKTKYKANTSREIKLRIPGVNTYFAKW